MCTRHYLVFRKYFFLFECCLKYFFGAVTTSIALKLSIFPIILLIFSYKTKLLASYSFINEIYHLFGTLAFKFDGFKIIFYINFQNNNLATYDTLIYFI